MNLFELKSGIDNASTDDADILVAHRGTFWLIDSDNPSEQTIDQINAALGTNLFDDHFDYHASVRSMLEDHPDVIVAGIEGNELQLSSSIIAELSPSRSKLFAQLAKHLGYSWVTEPTLDDDEITHRIIDPEESGVDKIKSLLHGTTLNNLQGILKTGLTPNNDSNWKDNQVEHEDLIFGTTNPIIATYHANRLSGRPDAYEDYEPLNWDEDYGAVPVVIEFGIPDHDQIVPDFDIMSATDTDNEMNDELGYSSMMRHDNHRAVSGVMDRNPEKRLWKSASEYGYRGRIPASFIKHIWIEPGTNPISPKLSRNASIRIDGQTNMAGVEEELDDWWEHFYGEPRGYDPDEDEDLDENLTEDAENDRLRYQLVMKATNALVNYDIMKFRPDHQRVKYGNRDAYRIWGSSIDDMPEDFKNIQFIIHDIETWDEKPKFVRTRTDARFIFLPFLISKEIDFDGFAEYDQRMKATLDKMGTEDIKKVIYHELTHAYQDNNSQITTNSTGDSGKDYFNNPSEFDAFTMEVVRSLHELATAMEETPEQARRLAIKAGFQEDVRDYLKSFSEAAEKDWSKVMARFLDNLTDKRYRRMVKRVVGAHDYVRELISKAPEKTAQSLSEGEEFWGSAGAGLIVVAADTGSILMPLRSQWVMEPGTYGVWGGAIDPGEDPQSAAIREFEEESGYNGSLQNISQVFRFQKGDFVFTTFVAVVPHEFEPRLNWETESTQWTPIDQVHRLNLHFGMQDIWKDHNAVKKIRSMVE